MTMAQSPDVPDFERTLNAGLIQPLSSSWRQDRPDADTKIAIGRPGRELCLYQAAFGYDMQGELEFLTNRAMEPNMDQVGIYFAATKIIVLVQFVAFAVKAASGPRFSVLLATNDRPALASFSAEVARWSFWPSLAIITAAAPTW